MGVGCTSTRRLFLHSSIAPSFLASLTAAYTSTLTRVGDPLLHSTLIGPLHNADGVAKFEQAIKEIETQGGKILVGGKVRKMDVGSGFEGGNWVEPTIAVFEDSRKAEVMRRETFAPSQSCPLCFFGRYDGDADDTDEVANLVLFVSTFETLEEAIELNNSVDQGLSSSLFTR